MRNIVKGAAVLAAMAMLFRRKKGSAGRVGRNENRGLWRKTPPNPDSIDKFGDIG